MFSVEYDVVWFDPSRWRAAMGLVKHLTKTEITARGLEGMRGLRVNMGAPIPHDVKGVYHGARGVCMLTNFLGSLGLAERMGAVKADGGVQYACMAEICRSIEVLERDADNNPILVGGLLYGTLIERPEIKREIETQRQIEVRAMRQSDVMDASICEVLTARVLLFTCNKIAEPVMRALRFSFATRVLSLIPLALFTLALMPLGAYLRLKQARRAAKRWAMLSEPFNPVAEAQSALSSIARRR